MCSLPVCPYVFCHISVSLSLSVSHFPAPFANFILQSLLGDGPLRLLLLPSIHLEALDLLSALILA